jgi:hypothetical protein
MMIMELPYSHSILAADGASGWALVELAPGSSRTLATRPRAVATSDRSFNL